MNRERLDHILVRRGLVTEAQIQRALQRQRARGGRLGANLVYLEMLSEDDLATALGDQFGVPPFCPGRDKVEPYALARVPNVLIERLQAFPFALDRARNVLRVVVADPSDEHIRAEIEGCPGVGPVELCVTGESTLRRLLNQYLRGLDGSGALDRIVELPDLFGGEPAAVLPPVDVGAGPGEPQRRVLLVSRQASLATFLAPVLEREGCALLLASDPTAAAPLLKPGVVDQVLVGRELLDEFGEWVRSGKVPRPRGEIGVFDSLRRALLEQPANYDRMAAALLRSVQLLAELRDAGGSASPYERMCQDVRRFGSEMGLRRLAIDGLQVAVHLLRSQEPESVRRTHTRGPTAGAAGGPAGARGGQPGQGGHGGGLALVDFDRTLDMARRLDFPWDVEGALRSFLELITELHPGDAEGDGVHGAAAAADGPALGRGESLAAAQLLALVWLRHVAIEPVAEADGVETLRSRLRSAAARVAPIDMIEAYLRWIEVESGGRMNEAKQVLVVGSDHPDTRAFVAQLGSAGYRTVRVRELAEAEALCQRHPPAVVLVDYDSFGERARSFRRRLRVQGLILCYAWTHQPRPSLHIDLLDAGYVDVFAPPFIHDVIAARIARSLAELDLRAAELEQRSGFTASFTAFHFIELIQAMGQSQRSARIVLSGGDGETAEVYLQQGQMIFARCGRKAGEEAVYRIVAWGEKGSFRVESPESFPAPNIKNNNESVLLEGCRRLDESLV